MLARADTTLAHPAVVRAAPAPTHAAFRAATYFATLDVLRAIAIVAVIWHHAAAPSFAAGIAQTGYHGVTLFFAISGFLIVTLLLREKAATGGIAMRGFMIKRALRILPLYYATLLVYVAVVAGLEKDAVARAQFFANLPAFASFTTNWLVAIDAPRVIFYFAWSLAAEEQFYLVWPWIERARLGKYFGLIAAGVAVALSPDVAGALWPAAEPQPILLVALSRLPGAIGLGVILAHMLHDPKLFRWLGPVIGRRGSALVLGVALLGVLASGGVLGRGEPAVVDLLCMLLVGAAAVRPDNDLSFVARIPGVLHIGVVSYGVYLLHMLAANAAKVAGKPFGLAGGLALFVATLVLAVALASLSHATFERWMHGLRRRLL